MDKRELKEYCEREITEYRYEIPSSVVGNPWPEERVAAQLQACREALVTPYMQVIELRDTPEQMAATPPVLIEAWVVADDKKNYKVFFNPTTREFGLAEYDPTDHTRHPRTFNVTGDFVGTFMAR